MNFLKNFISMMAFLLPLSLSAALFDIGPHKVELPFSQKMLAKASKPESHLLFIDPSWPSPRPIITLSISPFQFPPDDVSEFDKIFREKKGQWLSKSKAQLIGGLAVDYDKASRSVISKMSFSLELGQFEEWTRFQQCSANGGLILKFMVPKTFIQNHTDTAETWEMALKSSLCELDLAKKTLTE